MQRNGEMCVTRSYDEGGEVFTYTHTHTHMLLSSSLSLPLLLPAGPFFAREEIYGEEEEEERH